MINLNYQFLAVQFNSMIQEMKEKNSNCKS